MTEEWCYFEYDSFSNEVNIWRVLANYGDAWRKFNLETEGRVDIYVHLHP